VQQRPTKASELAQAQAEAERLEREAERVRHELTPYSDLDGRILQARQARDAHLQAHETYLAYVGIAQQREARRNRLQEAQAEAKAAALRLEQAQTQYQQAQAGYRAEEHAQVKGQAESLREQLAVAKTELQQVKRRLQETQQELGRLQALQGDLGRKQAERQELEGLHKLVEEVRDLLKKAGPYVTRQLVTRISHEASALYGDIMGDHTGRLNWTEDYDLILEYKGRKRSFQQLSGGEQMTAALALRLALLRKTSDIQVAFFDEPTTHLDPERREGLAEKIMQIRGFEQLFVISHDDTFERAAQSYIRIVKDERGSHWARED